MTVQAAKPTLLRIGIIIDSFLQPRWVRKSLENALATNLCTFAVVVKVKPQRTSGGSLFYQLYDRMDRRLFPAAATEPVSVEDLFSDTAVIEDVDKIPESDLDLLINFSSTEWNEELSNGAKNGVWFHGFGDAPGFDEVMNQTPITHTSLRSLQGKTEKVIYSSVSPTLSRFSVGLNNNTCYWKSAAFIARALRDLHNGENEVLSSNQRREKSKTPGNAAMSRMFLKLSGRAAARAVEKFSSFDQWILAYRFDRDEFKYLIPPADHFWADPFQIKVDGKYYIFFEDYVNDAGRAHISVVEVDRNGIVSGPTEVLKLNCHLSYPFVFEWQGGYYMIPEMGERNVVELYRAHSFPFEWKPEKVLLEARSPLDATLVEAEGMWWMFVNLQEEGVAVNWDELHLYYAENPLGPWQPHARNPVVSNVLSARPAGRLFWSNNVLYRPSQDSSLRYGYATTISKVASLSTATYAETEVLKILPDWDNDIIGIHTVNWTDEMTVIDCLMKRRRFGKVRLQPVRGSLDLLSSANMEDAALKSFQPASAD
jgi:hypothetical protein